MTHYLALKIYGKELMLIINKQNVKSLLKILSSKVIVDFSKVKKIRELDKKEIKNIFDNKR